MRKNKRGARTGVLRAPGVLRGVVFRLKAEARPDLLRLARCRAAEEQARAVGEDEVPPDGFVRPVLRQVSLDDQRRPDRHGLAGDALANQLIRAAAFNHPFLALDLHMEPGVRVHHVPLQELAFELDRLVHVELGSERMMRTRHAACAQQRHADNDCDESRPSGHCLYLVPPDAFAFAASAARFSSSRAPARMPETPMFDSWHANSKIGPLV